MSMPRSIKQLFASKWREAILSGLSLVIGIVVGPVLDKLLVPNLFTEPNLLYLVFVIIALIFLLTFPVILSMWKDTNQQIEVANQYFKVVSDAIGRKARLVTAREGYKEISQRLENAEREILILSNYAFDWENGKPIFDAETLQSPERNSLYALLRAKIKEKRDLGVPFKFCRIVQVPEGHDLTEVFPYDNYYYESSRFIVNISKSNPELASLRTVEPLFTNTFVIIDRRYLYIEFNAYTPDIAKVFTPFVLLIDDPTSQIVSDMLTLYQRIESVSTLVRSIP